VGRLERWRERDVFAIVDYLASPAWMYPLLARATALPEARGLTAIRCRTLSPGNDLAFLAAGFVRVDPDDGRGGLIRASSSAFRFMVHERGADGRGDSDGASRPALDRRRWFVTAGDSDMSLA
jgi:hypothetical protein